LPVLTSPPKTSKPHLDVPAPAFAESFEPLIATAHEILIRSALLAILLARTPVKLAQLTSHAEKKRPERNEPLEISHDLPEQGEGVAELLPLVFG